MGDKYIIELEDKPFHKEDGDFLYRVKGFNSLVFDMTGISKLTPYTEPDLAQVRKYAYKIGYEKGYRDGVNRIGDAEDKIRKEAYQQGYEQGYKDGYNEPGKGKIQVGDEVRNIKGGWIAVVSNIDGECMTLMDTNGALGDGYDVNRFTKTGRHFPEIAAVLKKMRGEQDG